MKHAFIRIYLYFLFALFFLSLGLSLVIFAPLYKMAFAPKYSIRGIGFFKLWKSMYKIAWRSITSKKYRSMYSHQKLWDPPKLHTDTSTANIKSSWTGEINNCDACPSACCRALGCPLLAENGRCLSFSSIFFTYLNCGRFPETKDIIDYYDCPKWKI